MLRNRKDRQKSSRITLTVILVILEIFRFSKVLTKHMIQHEYVSLCVEICKRHAIIMRSQA